MECSQISNLIMKYIDGDISEVELKVLNKHRLSCDKCSQEFIMMTEMVKCISELPEIPAPYYFESKVMEGIKQRKSRTGMFNMLVGAVGLFVFAYYMALFVIFPFLQNSGVFQAMLSYGFFVLKFVGEYITRIIVYLPVTIDNLLVLRNILLEDYRNIMLLIAGGVMLLNLGLIRVINLQHE